MFQLRHICCRKLCYNYFCPPNTTINTYSMVHFNIRKEGLSMNCILLGLIWISLVGLEYPKLIREKRNNQMIMKAILMIKKMFWDGNLISSKNIADVDKKENNIADWFVEIFSLNITKGEHSSIHSNSVCIYSSFKSLGLKFSTSFVYL